MVSFLVYFIPSIYHSSFSPGRWAASGVGPGHWRLAIGQFDDATGSDHSRSSPLRAFLDPICTSPCMFRLHLPTSNMNSGDHRSDKPGKPEPEERNISPISKGSRLTLKCQVVWYVCQVMYVACAHMCSSASVLCCRDVISLLTLFRPRACPRGRVLRPSRRASEGDGDHPNSR